MIDYKDKINIVYNNEIELNKNDIGYVIYCKTILEDLSDFCNQIYYLLLLGNWILKDSNIDMYVSDNNDENKDEYNKVVYIKYEEVNSEIVKTESFRKIFDFKEQDNTVVSTGYEVYNVDDYAIYSSCERKIDNSVEFSPYCSDVIDKNNLLPKDIFMKIEEIYAKENYRKSLLKTYKKLNNRLYADLGFSYEVINDENDINIDKGLLKPLEIKEHINAIKEIYSVIYDKKLDDSSLAKLVEYLKDIEYNLGSYIEMYLVEEDDKNNDDSINPFYIDFGVWLVKYQNASLIISYGSDE